MRYILIALMGLAFAGPATFAQDVIVRGRHLFVLLVDAGDVRVTVKDPAAVAAHVADDHLLVFLTGDGTLWAADVRPLADGSLPDPHPTPITNLSVAIGDLSWWTPRLGFLPEAQARPEDGLHAGDLVVAKQDFDGTQLVRIIARHEIENELECVRALSFR